MINQVASLACDFGTSSCTVMPKMLLISFDRVKLQGDCDFEDLPLGFLYDLYASFAADSSGGPTI